MELAVIDPFPAALCGDIQCTLVRRPVQSVPLDEFTQLVAGDILFIDSSHVVATGSDVCYLLLDILPVLAD